jgi:hypothetical protein
MPLLLNNPTHWNLRTQEALLVAQQLEDLEAKTAILKRLAVRAAARPISILACHVLADIPGDGGYGGYWWRPHSKSVWPGLSPKILF